MFSCEISKNFKNNYFEEHLQTTASVDMSLHSISLAIGGIQLMFNYPFNRSSLLSILNQI